MRKIGSLIYWLALGVAMALLLCASDIFFYGGIVEFALICLTLGYALYVAIKWARQTARNTPDNI
jgi:hypothetical protein